MKERNTGLRRVLLSAPVYWTAQRLIGAEKFGRIICSETVRSSDAMVIVDMGCGTAHIADRLDFRSYVGFDPNPAYVKAAQERLSADDRCTVFHAGIGDPALIDHLPGTADLVMAVGVFHHVDDGLVNEGLELAASIVGSTGRLVAFDPGYVSNQSRIARALISRDRGQHVRTVEETRRLVEEHFSEATVTPRNDLLNVPYTHLIVEASNPSLIAPPEQVEGT